MVVSFCSLFALYAVEFNVVFLGVEQDPFPLEAVCGHPWQNGEGQLSFLIHAVSAPPEVFTFAHSLRKQVPLCAAPGLPRAFQRIMNFIETFAVGIFFFLA